MIWLRQKITYFAVYAIIVLLFFIIPFGFVLGVMWMFGEFRNPWWPLSVLGIAIFCGFKARDEFDKFVLETMERMGVRDLRKL